MIKDGRHVLAVHACDRVDAAIGARLHFGLELRPDPGRSDGCRFYQPGIAAEILHLCSGVVRQGQPRCT